MTSTAAPRGRQMIDIWQYVTVKPLGYKHSPKMPYVTHSLLIVFSHRVAAGQNSSCGSAGRGHHNQDRERLEETKHPHALPGPSITTTTTGLQVEIVFVLFEQWKMPVIVYSDFTVQCYLNLLYGWMLAWWRVSNWVYSTKRVWRVYDLALRKGEKQQENTLKTKHQWTLILTREGPVVEVCSRAA